MPTPSGPIDFDQLSARCFGDRDLADELLDLFARQCERLAPALLEGTTAREAREAAHTLVGSAATVGADAVTGLARRAEAAWAEGGQPDAGLVAELRGALQEARAAAIGRRRQGADLAKASELF